MSKRLSAFVLLMLGACAPVASNDSRPAPPHHPPHAEACISAYTDVPPVLAAYLDRMVAGSGDPTIVTMPVDGDRSLLDLAEDASEDPGAERLRAVAAADSLVWGYLAPFMDAAAIPEWRASLTAAPLTPEQVRQAGLSADRLIQARFAARGPVGPWGAIYRQMASQRIEAILAVVGAPPEWGGTADVHEAVWQVALLIGADAGDAAFNAALASGAVPEDAVMAAIQATLGANQTIFDAVLAGKVAEALALINTH